MTETSERRSLANVLVVEDDDAQRQTLCDILHQEGYAAVPCANAAEALDLAQNSRAAVAILDLRLPDMNGLAVLRELLKLLQGTRVIIHTGYGSFESAREALNLGAFAYVEKLSDPRELIGHVHRAMDELLQHALGQSEQELRLLTEHVSDLLLQVDRRGKVLFANRAFPGHGVGEILGGPLRDWIRPDSLESLETAVGRVFDAYVPQQCEFVVQGGDGAPRWYSCRIGPIGSASEVERAVIIARDVTEERQAQQIERVMLQLFRNAREATSAGGTLTVEIQDVVLDETDFDGEPEAPHGPHVLISVSDDGPGIRPEDLDHIFDPFFTTKVGKSKGLGLTEVYGVVAEAGGHLSVESEPGAGTTVRVYLPTLARPRAGKAAPPPRGSNVVRRFRRPES